MPKYYLKYYLRKAWIKLLRNTKWMSLDRYDELLNFYRQTFKRVPSQVISNNKLVRDYISEEQFLTLARNTFKQDPKVDIVITAINGGFIKYIQCIANILQVKNELSFDLIIVNCDILDKSQSGKLHEIADKFGFTYLNSNNKKSIGNLINHAISMHPDRDVLWLDSDSEVFDNFLDRMHAIAYAQTNCASITPISNNAASFGYPLTSQDNLYALLVEDKNINILAADVNSGINVEAPTGLGYCLYIKRVSLNQVGMFDEKFCSQHAMIHDLCWRFVKSGYTNLITPTVFVRQYASTTYEQKKNGFFLEHLLQLREKHPDYLVAISDFISADPLKSSRIRLDARTWLSTHKYEQTVLHLVHAKGGGTQGFIDALTLRLNSMNIGSLILHCSDTNALKADVASNDFPNLEHINFSYSPEELEALILGAKVKHIHVHSLISFDYPLILCLKELKKRSDIKITVSIHDYDWICSAINLMPDAAAFDATYCTNPKNARCILCDRRLCNSTFTKRLYSKALFSFADRITVPDEDVADKMSSLFPDVEFCIVPHNEDYQFIKTNSSAENQKLIIGCLGLIQHTKGFNVVEKLTKYIKDNNLNAECVIIGSCPRNLHPVTRTTGPYNRDNLTQFVQSEHPSVWFQTSIVPETYSYTLSEMLATDIPVACFDIGAPARRLRKLGLGSNLISYDQRFNPGALFDRLQEISKSRLTVPYVQRETPLGEYYPNIQAHQNPG